MSAWDLTPERRNELMQWVSLGHSPTELAKLYGVNVGAIAHIRKKMRSVHSVIRVRTRETICHPDISQLILRGAHKVGLPQPAAALAEIVGQIAEPGIGLFVGFDGHDPKIVALAQLPSSAFHLAPTVSLAYSEGEHTLSVAVGARLRNWLCEAGFYHALAINMQHTDRVFMRGLAYFGAPTRVGSVIRFSF